MREFNSHFRKAEKIFFMWLRQVKNPPVRGDFLLGEVGMGERRTKKESEKEAITGRRSIEAMQRPFLLENPKEKKLFGAREWESVAWQVSAFSHTFRCCLYLSLSGVS